MNTPKTIVIIDDNESIRTAFKRFLRALGSLHEIIFLTNLDEAEAFLEDDLPGRDDIVAITFDGSLVPGKRSLDTLHLVKLAKEANFAGILLACSSDDHYCNLLIEAGCTNKVTSKDQMPPELLGLLK